VVKYRVVFARMARPPPGATAPMDPSIEPLLFITTLRQCVLFL
jgi:hypothetical protein